MSFSEEFLGEETPVEEWRSRMNMNLSGAYNSARHGDLMPEFREKLTQLLVQIEE